MGICFNLLMKPGMQNNLIPVLELIESFLNTPVASIVSAGHGGVTPTTLNTPLGILGITNIITQQNNQSNASPTKPRAFINVIFFDEQFKTYEGGFAISMVGNIYGQVKSNHFEDLQNLVAKKNGYVYIYCSNESPVDVFFDNLGSTYSWGCIGGNALLSFRVDDGRNKFKGYR